MKVCVHFLTGDCMMQEHCANYHPTSPEEVCAWVTHFLARQCKYGNQCNTRGCLYGHPAQAAGQAPPGGWVPGPAMGVAEMLRRRAQEVQDSLYDPFAPPEVEDGNDAPGTTAAGVAPVSSPASPAPEAGGVAPAPAGAPPEETEEELSKLSVKELKQRLQGLGIQPPAGVLEKPDLVAALRRALQGRRSE